MTPPLKKGDRVTLTCQGHTVEALVVLASPNGRSLAFRFEAMLDGHVGSMATLQDDAGIHRTLITDNPVTIKRLEP